MYFNTDTDKPAISSLFIFFGIVLIGLVLGNVVGGILMILISGSSFSEITNISKAIMLSPNGWWALIAAQGATALVSFVGSGLLYWYLVEQKKWADFSPANLPKPAILLLVFISQLAFTPVNGYIQSLNEKMKLPSSLKALEDFMKSMEDSMADLTTFLTTFNSPLQFIAAFIVIAVIAGIGEELIFRGILQRKLLKAFGGNHHAAIWVAAAIFSAIHVQFYGFFPRMFLGAMFGYFYFWSGNIWVPMLAHIFNNGLAVIMLYLVKQKIVSPEIEKLDTVPLPIVICSLLIFSFLILQLKSNFSKISTSN